MNLHDASIVIIIFILLPDIDYCIINTIKTISINQIYTFIHDWRE